MTFLLVFGGPTFVPKHHKKGEAGQLCGSKCPQYECKPIFQKYSFQQFFLVPIPYSNFPQVFHKEDPKGGTE